MLTSSLNLGVYAGRLDNLNLAGINNPIPNLTNMYLDTPLVGPTPEPLEYVPSSGRLGLPRGYYPSSTGPRSDSDRQRPPPPPPPYNMHPRMRASLGRAQPLRVVHATGLGENSKILAPRGEPLEKFQSAALVRPSRPLRPKFCQGVPPGFLNPNFFLARCWSVWAPSHFPAPPPVLLSVWGGGGRPLQSCRLKFFQGFPPWGQNFGVFT